MELIKIELENYKSITESIGVEFHKNLPTVLIGKNGSGKSNILEALEHIASTNSNLPGKYSARELRYKAYIRLDNSEFAKLFPNEEYSEEKAEFSAYSSAKDGLHINTIESETIVPLLRKELENVLELTNELEDTVASYEKALKKIECDDRDSISLRGYDIIDSKGNTTNYDVLKFKSQFFIEQIRQLSNSFVSNIKSENIFCFSLPHYTLELYPPHAELTPFKLRYKAPEIAQFEQKFITINESAIKREITKINKRTENACKKVDEILNKLKAQSDRLLDTAECGVITEFIRNVTKVFGNNCAYLLSENSQVLFKDLKKENDNRYYNPSAVIFEAYAKSHNKKDVLNDKNYVISNKERIEFEQWLNANLPKFECGMYEKIPVDLDEKDQLSICIHENNKQIVPLNETSAGRRWYFTYYFVKNTLSPGDTFIIDEPASMLHPSAQKEILSDICEMTKNGIRVIYSTHSPYLIPEDWSCVGFVSMSNSTQITYVDTKDERDIFFKDIVGDIFDLESIVETLQKSDPKEIAENCYLAIKNKDSTFAVAAKQLNLSEDTIKSWHRKGTHFRSPKLENIIAVASFTNTSITNLLK